jgi:peptidoglycan/xylan/chitin deacetylase (PgdA/CDA1 family)
LAVTLLAVGAAAAAEAIFFLVGQMATSYADVGRKVAAAGHTIGTHNQNHPLRLEKMPFIKAEQEINEGIASVSAALGEPPAPSSPFQDWRAQIDQYLAFPEADDLERRLPCRRLDQDHSGTGAFR